ncbi:MAG: DUF87 domain-containing protein [Clostridia bacterium]|nr:DUF87 domain-containing protein [Clostridia bacterium]
MAKRSAQKKGAAQYNTNTLATFVVVGIVLIALGVVSLLSVAGGLKGSVFDWVKHLMQGIGGGLCIVVSVLWLWLGVLVAFSAGRKMPKRGFILITIMFVAVLGIVNLMSKIGTYTLMDYLVSANKSLALPSPDGFWNMLKAAYRFCADNGACGGMLGMLLAWPAWTFLGNTLGIVALGLICAVCLLLVSRFDLLQMVDTVKQGWGEGKAKRQQKQAEEAYQQQLAMQQQQAAEAERMRQNTAYARRAQQQVQVAYPAYENAVEQPGYTQQPPQQQGEIYDEIIMPQDKQPLWKRKKNRQEQPPVENYQTRMTFTPSEMGVTQEEEPQNKPLVLSSSRKKTLERIESIRQRKAELNEEIEGNEMARGENVPTFAPAVSGPQQEYYDPEDFGEYETEDDMEMMELEPIEQPAPDPQAAYKRPKKIAPAPSFQPLNGPISPENEPAEERKGNPAQIYSHVKEQSAQYAVEKLPYAYPSIDLLNQQKQRENTDTRAADAEDASRLEQTLESFGIPARVQRVTHGPAVTRFELGLVSSGINVKRIMGIADNIALDMAANGGVRIEIPIPGTNLFGVEVPNKEIQSVTLAEVLMSNEMRSAKSPLAVALGRDIAGRPVICDIAKMPHLLIAGQTGSGKSVCINAIINSLLFRSSPEEVRMIMIDPKVVELQCYNVVPHLLIPVVSDPHKAAGALQWAVAEMLDRYHKMQSKNVREISAYNAKLGPDEEKLPRIVIIIDELADLMLACKKEVEESIIRIAQLARAAGIHMIVATQRPTVDVITGLIKANIPSRIAFAVSSSIDSRTILDQNGAEKLLGRGDMFYFPTGASSPMRVQGCFLSDSETERVVDYIGSHSSVDFDSNVIEAMENDGDAGAATMNEPDDGEGVDDRLAEAIEMVITDGQASISMLQRRMKIGYARAGRLIDEMASRGIVSKSAGSKPREVLISREEYERMKDSLV